ncbi:TPA: hypothetical protein ACN69F_004943 [Klebsiella pneumoniae]
MRSLLTMIEAGQFNGSTLVIGEDWQILTIHEILWVQGLSMVMVG